MTTQIVKPDVMNITADKKHVTAVTYTAVYLLWIVLFHKLFPLFPNYNENIYNFVHLLGYFVLGTASIFFFRELFRKGINEWKEHTMNSFKWLIGGLIAETVLKVLAVIPVYVIFPDYESVNQGNVEELINKIPVLIGFLIIGIFGPVAEETIFRFIAVERGKEKLPVALCIIVSSLLFMFLHVHAMNVPEIMSCMPHFFTGMVFAVIMLKSKNPTIPLILHILNNSFGTLVVLMNR